MVSRGGCLKLAPHRERGALAGIREKGEGRRGGL
jgi:hypothetical protein